MFLDLEDAKFPEKRVYTLLEDLRQDVDRVKLAQTLTCDPSKPLMGLKGSHGLFGSDEWWKNIENGVIPTSLVSGVIKRAYVAGQDSSEINDTIDIISDEGNEISVGIYTNNPEDVALFQPGHTVRVIYAFDELKRQPASDGSVNYSKVALEMTISEEPV